MTNSPVFSVEWIRTSELNPTVNTPVLAVWDHNGPLGITLAYYNDKQQWTVANDAEYIIEPPKWWMHLPPQPPQDSIQWTASANGKKASLQYLPQSSQWLCTIIGYPQGTVEQHFYQPLEAISYAETVLLHGLEAIK